MLKFFKNPISIWVKTCIKNLYLELRNYDKNIQIGYLSRINNVIFSKGNKIGDNVDLNNVRLGMYSYIAGNSNISNANIGSYCSIGDRVKIGGGRHPTNLVSTHPVIYRDVEGCNDFSETLSVNIGSDVWIGSAVTILDGVTIGDGAIIGAGAIVVKNVESFTINGGIPCKLIRRRFSEEYTDKLLQIKWWDKGDEWILKNKKLFFNIDKFIKKIDNEKKR